MELLVCQVLHKSWNIEILWKPLATFTTGREDEDNVEDWTEEIDGHLVFWRFTSPIHSMNKYWQGWTTALCNHWDLCYNLYCLIKIQNISAFTFRKSQQKGWKLSFCKFSEAREADKTNQIVNCFNNNQALSVKQLKLVSTNCRNRNKLAEMTFLTPAGQADSPPPSAGKRSRTEHDK